MSFYDETNLFVQPDKSHIKGFSDDGHDFKLSVTKQFQYENIHTIKITVT